MWETVESEVKKSKKDEKKKYSGIVEDCYCDYETVDHLNEEVLHPILQDLVKTPFSRYFKVNIWCNCPFCPDDGMFRLRDCSVCEESEFPESFKKPYHYSLPSDDLKCQEGKLEATDDRVLDSKAFRGWTETDNPWTYDDETDNCESDFFSTALTFSVSFACYHVLDALKFTAYALGIDS
ncbi:Endoplasmic reticulum oxidoreductin-2 [Hibiscus syriacus]|uniref:Endoplasmic reticulum oxidoreductin-2 n=1 Tax=Hibiscus syriacus TaxID=106335 RepID=A0A6A3BX01_HIBSY|nr:Endoplasmic reticulum oxidoreductin-2 [Hibiscus syriacus]